MVILTPMDSTRFASYREAAAIGYAEDNVASGRWPKEGALQRAMADFDESLPQGMATPDNYLYGVTDEKTNAVVGMLWFAVVVKNGLRLAFVYDIEIRTEFRRQGHARAAFYERHGYTVRELTRYGETIVLAQMHKPAHAGDA